MARQVSLSQVEGLLDELSYPVMRIDAAREFADVTLQFADSEANLGELIGETKNDAFSSIDDLETELRDVISGDPPDLPSRSEKEV